MNELVFIENDNVVVSSRDIANSFGKLHKHVLDNIENIKAENSAVTSMFFKTSYKAGTGKKYKEYLMNRDGFSLLAMGFTGAKALEWKLKYINAFNEMEAEIKNKIVARTKSIGIRHILTDTIRDSIPESPHKKFAYPNYTKLTYKILFNKTAKELKDYYKTDSIRDCLTTEELQ